MVEGRLGAREAGRKPERERQGAKDRRRKEASKRRQNNERTNGLERIKDYFEGKTQKEPMLVV